MKVIQFVSSFNLFSFLHATHPPPLPPYSFLCLSSSHHNYYLYTQLIYLLHTNFPFPSHLYLPPPLPPTCPSLSPSLPRSESLESVFVLVLLAFLHVYYSLVCLYAIPILSVYVRVCMYVCVCVCDLSKGFGCICNVLFLLLLLLLLIIIIFSSLLHLLLLLLLLSLCIECWVKIVSNSWFKIQ